MEDKNLEVIPTAMVQIEQSRAVQEVQAALVIAQRFPRDKNKAYADIIETCKRYNLAAQATYSYPKGGAVVSGPSIRLAEVIAQNYGNLNFGVRELERRNGVSIAESYCWDMEKNVKQTKVFEVPHEIQKKNGELKILRDPRDIYEIVANQGARRLRACILGIIPPDFVDAAVAECKKTLAKGNGDTMEDRIRKIVVLFKDLGVSQQMLEDRLGHGAELITGEQIADLASIYNSLKENQSKRGDFFSFPEDDSSSKAATLKDKLEKEKK